MDEILSAVQMHYILDASHRWVENPRPFRDKWITLLQAIGEKLPSKRDPTANKVDCVEDIHELTPPPFKPKLLQTQSQVSAPLPSLL